MSYDDLGVSNDQLIFDSAIALQDLSFERINDDLSISLNTKGVVINDYFTDPSKLVEEIIVGGEQLSIAEPEVGVDLLV